MTMVEILQQAKTLSGQERADKDQDMRDIRNKATHDEVLRRDEARQTRSWAMQILGQV